MEITREMTGELTATVKMHLEPKDYTENINKVLKEYQRKANIPGFRPGHVPFGLVKKMYGAAVFADEINRLVSEELSGYISNEKLDILGQPIPSDRETPQIDWNTEQEIDFYFDLGFASKYELKLDDSIQMDYNLIKAGEDLIDKYVQDARQRFGTVTNPETVGATDMLLGKFEQLDNEGNLLEGGIEKESRLAVDTLKDQELTSQLIGKMAGDHVVFNPMKATGNATEAAAMLGVDKNDTENLESDYRFTITEISAVVPAEMNQEFYNKVFPDSDLTSEAELREKIRRETEEAFVADSDHLFMHTAQDKLVEITGIRLPDEYMKRSILERNDSGMDQETLERDYEKIAASLKWQLIENHIIKEAGIEVSDNEIKDHVKDYYLQGWRSMPLSDDLSRRLDEIAESFMKDRPHEARNIMDSIYAKRVIEYIKTKVKLVNKEISYKEFLKLDAAKH